MSKATKPDFWNSFSALLAKKDEKRPEGSGWKSLDELVKLYGHNRTNVAAKLGRGVSAGIIERFIGKTVREGRLQTTSWYRQTP